MRKELLSRKDPALGGSGNFEPIQIAKDTKIRRFPVRMMCSVDRAKGVARQPLAST